MHLPPDILTLAYKQPFMQGQLKLLQEKECQIPGSVQYMMRRYQKDPKWNLEDTGVMIYHYQREKASENYFELRFCLTGNIYCKSKEKECDNCRFHTSRSCPDHSETVDVMSFRFSPVHLSQFVKPQQLAGRISDNVLHFKHPSSFSKILSLCSRTRMVLETLLNQSYSGSLENIFINAQTQMLLLYSLECMIGEKDVESFQCKFLANDADREKINLAREILLEHIGEPLTIRELSRKVAINECYLKKGFKELFGTTIFDFYQGQRM